jgi:hypothetical protein
MTDRNQKSDVMQADEDLKWALIASHAQEAFYHVNNWVDLRDADNRPLDNGAKARFTCIIRAVSWVESKHGTAGANQPGRDPMQCGNPNDIWWRTVTGQGGNGDRFVRGPNYTGAVGAYWAGELAGVFDKDAPAEAKVTHLGNSSEQRNGHRNSNFNAKMSFFWGVLYLIHRTNTNPTLGSTGRTYKCGDSSMARLFDGAIRYNGSGDPAYGDKIREALDIIGCG